MRAIICRMCKYFFFLLSAFAVGECFASVSLDFHEAECTHTARADTRIFDDGRLLAVRCSGGGYGWPGVEIRPRNGAWDWTRFAELHITVSNHSATAEKIMVGVGGTGEKIFAYQGSGVPAHSVRSIRVPLNDAPCMTEEALDWGEDMKSMLPSGGGRAGFSSVTIVTVYNEQPGTPHPLAFTVQKMRLVQRTAEQRVIAAGSFFPFVDTYGQFIHAEWPGKIHTPDELAADWAAEDAFLNREAASPISGANIYGGWAAGPKRRASGFFRVEKINGKWWFVDPAGSLFFSLGVGSILPPNQTTRIAGRDKFFAALPRNADGTIPSHMSFTERNLVRRFGSSWQSAFDELILKRCRIWGFNTLGCWCARSLTDRRRLPYTATIDRSSSTRLATERKPGPRPVPDVFSKIFLAELTEQVERLARVVKDDPWCLGVFVDNELDWQACGAAAGPAAEKYYATVRKLLKRSLPNHLYLGSRLHQAPEAVWRAAARHCDVVSSNIYLFEPVDDLKRYAPDKPLLIGEFHFGAKDRGRFGGGLVTVHDQKARGVALRRYIEACLDNPRYVGCHYFQLQDQEITGRFDGENWNIGFVSVCETPYPEMVSSLQDVARGMYARRWAADGKQSTVNKGGNEK